ncbi:hypothetical protein [Morganella psychrotolerans]|uniref:Uncharacterized protein n=1 Tax=Morganella psychrotolerans TaxID=368603 RepID=A0A1B8H4E3_9GAMM|nr:hypothetical protein [Morganella psychrotolerans]OBU03913.1 hypothetical protein AYY17_10195 [Morganella psychrotolerans]
MGAVQGTQASQVLQHMDNEIYSSAGIDSSSSYVSSSGIKSILSNAWNAIKSAFSNVLSSFGNHLSGLQGSAKPGREITMDMASRPAQSLPGFDAQPENTVYDSMGGDTSYASVYDHTGYTGTENIYVSADDMADICQPSAPQVPDSARPVLSESLYSEISDPLYEEIDGYRPAAEQTPPPVPDSPRPSLHNMTTENSLYESRESLHDNAEWENGKRN